MLQGELNPVTILGAHCLLDIFANLWPKKKEGYRKEILFQWSVHVLEVRSKGNFFLHQRGDAWLCRTEGESQVAYYVLCILHRQPCDENFDCHVINVIRTVHMNMCSRKSGNCEMENRPLFWTILQPVNIPFLAHQVSFHKSANVSHLCSVLTEIVTHCWVCCWSA